MKKSTCLLFFVFLVGVICANLMGIAFGKELGAMSGYFVNRYLYADIHGRELFLYLFYQRMPEILLLFLAGLSRYGVAVIGGWIGCLCFSVGFLSVIELMNYGIAGILLLIGFCIPQWLIYIPVCILWFRYSRKRMRETEEERNNWRLLPAVLFLLFLILAGLFLESYVNPFLLKKIIQILN